MCSVSLVVVAAFVLGRLGTGAGVRSARVCHWFCGGPPMSVTVAGSVACAIVLMRWVRMLELHCIVDVSGRTMWGMCCMMASRMCVPHSVPPGCCSVLAWMVRQGPFVCVRSQLSSLGLQVACPWVPAELCSMIVHVTEFSSASSQCWLSLSGMSVVVFEVTTLLRRGLALQSQVCDKGMVLFVRISRCSPYQYHFGTLVMDVFKEDSLFQAKQLWP